jgi:hypothetical protein
MPDAKVKVDMRLWLVIRLESDHSGLFGHGFGRGYELRLT